MFLFIFICMLLGICAGFLAGLLGIGGGMIIVPALTWLLPIAGIAEPMVMPMALGTSLSVIILTSLSSTRIHLKKGNIPWPIVRLIVPGLMLGAALGGSISQYIPDLILRILFVFMALFTAAKMWFLNSELCSRTLPGILGLFLIGMLIGLLASLTGLGGGVIMVPLLLMFGVSLLNAVACAAFCSVVVACVGSTSYIISGAHLAVPYSAGYIYLPALFSIASMSILLAPIGVKCTVQWPVRRIRRLFAVVVLAVAINMLVFR